MKDTCVYCILPSYSLLFMISIPYNPAKVLLAHSPFSYLSLFKSTQIIVFLHPQGFPSYPFTLSLPIPPSIPFLNMYACCSIVSSPSYVILNLSSLLSRALHGGGGGFLCHMLKKWHCPMSVKLPCPMSPLGWSHVPC